MSTTKNTQLTVEELELDAILRQDNGRAVLRRIMERGGLFTSTYTDDARKQAYLEGRRSMALDLYNEIKAVNANQLNNIMKVHDNG